MSRRPTPRLSLRFEAATLCAAVEAARILGDLVQHRHTETPHDARRAPEAQSAVLALVVARMQLLDAVLAGEADPQSLLAPHNLLERGVADDDDVVLEPGKRGQR